MSTTDLKGIIEQALAACRVVDGQALEGLEQLRDLQLRLQQGRFRLAVLGQFKRGKSTFLNALLGENLLPTDILPVTAIPTFIQSADTRYAEVVFADHRQSLRFNPEQEGSLNHFLADYVSEKGNPDNHRKVKHVDIGHPAPILRQGVVLVDTPGIGSTLKHNTEVAYQVLPQCDAALFLVSPDPPVTEAEIDYLRQIQNLLPRTFFLLNKVDHLDDEERTASLVFLAEQLKPLCEGAPQVLAISAKEGLAARLRQDEELWAHSGMQLVEQNLIDFFAREKHQTFQRSLQRRVRDQLHTLLLQLRLALKALQLPEVELKDKIASFARMLPDIEREKQASADVLKGDLKRLEGLLTKYVEDLRGQAKASIVPAVEEIIQSVADTEEMERQVRSLVSQRLPVFFTPALKELDEEIHRQAGTILSLHQQRCDALIEQVRRTAAELFSIPYQAPLVERVYARFETPAWSQELFISDLDPWGQKLTRKFFTQRFRRRRTIQRLRADVQKLLNENVEQMNWALRRGVDESFRRYGYQLDEQLAKTISATRAAMDVALQRKTEQSATVKGRIELLEKTVMTLQALAEQCHDET